MKKLAVILLLLAATSLAAQDLPHYKRIVKELSSAKYQGRGYARGGANKAGKYLQKEFQKTGECPNAGLLYTWESPIKFFKAYGDHLVDKPIIWVTPEAIEGVYRVRIKVDNQFLSDYPLFNVIAKVEGERHDSCYVFTAHYDHLGNLGRKIFYAGANDNASGTAAIVTLAANSDHYPFAVRNVPCIFLENEEGDAYQYYHTIFDNWQHAVFDSYEPVFKLVTSFIEDY